MIYISNIKCSGAKIWNSLDDKMKVSRCPNYIDGQLFVTANVDLNLLRCINIYTLLYIPVLAVSLPRLIIAAILLYAH